MFDDDSEGTVPDALGRMKLAADLGAGVAGQARSNLGIEVVRVQEPPSLSAADRWCALEIWTKNRTYRLDIGMTCISVTRRDTGLADQRSECVGARLGGGQLRRGNVAELCHPLPVPGTEAVFELTAGSRKRFVATSVVEKVVLRVGVVQVEPPRAEPTWKEITGRTLPPGAALEPEPDKP